MQVNQKSSCFRSSINGAVVLAVHGNSFLAMLNKTKTYFYDVIYVLFIQCLSVDLTQDTVDSKMSMSSKSVQIINLKLFC